MGHCPSYGFWVYNPKSHSLVNPKYAVKDSPQEQFDWAMKFFDEGDFIRAAEEFIRLVDSYDDSKEAPDAQYFAALSYHRGGKPYIAFQNYEKVIQHYPFSERIEEIIKAEYELGEFFYNRSRPKLMGVELMADIEKGIEIFQAIIDNMPYSEYADNAQFMIGLSHKKVQQYNDAVETFQNLIQEYPKSTLVENAKYEMAQCLYLVSGQADYDQEPTDEALEEFKKYSLESEDTAFQKEAKHTIMELLEKKAKSLYLSADFYRKQRKYKSALIYLNEILDEYPDTSYVPLAKNRIEEIRPHLERQEKLERQREKKEKKKQAETTAKKEKKKFLGIF